VALIGDAACSAVVLAAHTAGIDVQPYAVTFGERPAHEYKSVAERVGSELRVVELPAERLAADFVHLATRHRCFAIGDFEIGLVAMHLCEALPEREIWFPVHAKRAGWNAAARIARGLGKTLMNPLTLAPNDPVISVEPGQGLRETKEPPRDL
jgi:hypothetical protein